MKILIQSDEHGIYFNTAPNYDGWEHSCQYKFVSVYEASTVNTNMNVFNPSLDEFKPDVLVTHLGEADCGFVVWNQRVTQNKSIEDQVIQGINNYFNYLAEASKKVKYIVVTAPTLPSITNDGLNPKLSLAPNRKLVQATLLERTNLTLVYSEILKWKCKEHGYLYVDFNQHILDKGTVNHKFIDENNHNRLKFDVISPLWAKCIGDAIRYIGKSMIYQVSDK